MNIRKQKYGEEERVYEGQTGSARERESVSVCETESESGRDNYWWRYSYGLIWSAYGGIPSKNNYKSEFMIIVESRVRVLLCRISRAGCRISKQWKTQCTA